MWRISKPPRPAGPCLGFVHYPTAHLQQALPKPGQKTKPNASPPTQQSNPPHTLPWHPQALHHCARTHQHTCIHNRNATMYPGSSQTFGKLCWPARQDARIPAGTPCPGPSRRRRGACKRPPAVPHTPHNPPAPGAASWLDLAPALAQTNKPAPHTRMHVCTPTHSPYARTIAPQPRSAAGHLDVPMLDSESLHAWTVTSQRA